VPATENCDVLVVGGGIIGVCAAYYSAAAGATVTLLDRDDIGAGCSYGNAGLIVPSHSVPLAAPGVFRKALFWLLDPGSPFYIKPRSDRELLRWLRLFASYCNEEAVSLAIPVIRDLTRASIVLYREFESSAPGFAFGYRNNGLLTVYSTSRGQREGRTQAELLREFGIESRDLSAAAAREIVPAIRPAVIGGMYFPEDAHLVPADFVQGLAKKAAGMGVRIHPSTPVESFRFANRKVTATIAGGREFRSSEIVLASGAWSSALLRALNINLPMQPAKGYSVTVPMAPQTNLQTPLLLHEAKVAVTPMGGCVRLAGTLELAGFDTSINPRRVRRLVMNAQNCLSGIHDAHSVEAWAGLRPATPDGLPVVGRLKQFDNVTVATGHGMLGVTLGPITGKLVAEMVCHSHPTADSSALSPARFS
jgi:D-amino-acid dehydrogenase